MLRYKGCCARFILPTARRFIYLNEKLKSFTRYRFGKVHERAELKSSVSSRICILFPGLEKLSIWQWFTLFWKNSPRQRKREWNYYKGKLYDQNRISSKVCVYKESKGVHRVSQCEQYGLRITLEHAHDQESSHGYYVCMVVNIRKVIDPDVS